MKKYVIFVLVPLVFLFSCAAPVQYMGGAYPPTANVDIYYSAHDVKKPYRVFGKASDLGINIYKVQNKILLEAEKRGANGIIYSTMQNSNDATNGTSSGEDVLLNADFIHYTN